MGDISLTKHHVRRHVLPVCPIVNDKTDDLVKVVSPTFFFVIK